MATARKRPKPPFDVGDLGENRVQTLATQAGIVVNPVRRDKKGWDFCFQFPTNTNASHLRIDQLPPSLQCWVQVKTTTTGAKRHRVSLTNWDRLLRDPEPWFFIHVRLDGDGEIKTLSLAHVGRSWTERALRALYKLPSAEIPPRKSLSVRWSNEEALSLVPRSRGRSTSGSFRK